MTWPSMLNSGPPELPLLIAASVWMKSSYGPWRISRPRADTIPAVTLPPSPNGLPIARTQSPTREASESPNASAGSGLSDFTFSNAMSTRSSRPMSVAFSEVLSCRVTVISSAPSITWLLVTMMPDGSMMKPEPRLCMRRSGAGWLGLPWPPWPPWPPGRLRSRKSLKNCSNGEPGGNIGKSGPGPPARAVIVVDDDTLTTPGSSFAARSAKLSGAGRAAAGVGASIGTSAGVTVASGRASVTARAVRTERYRRPGILGNSLELNAIWAGDCLTAMRRVATRPEA